MTNWEYCILTRLSSGIDTKWYVNRTYQHTENSLPEEVTPAHYRRYNASFDKLHAGMVLPILPSILNLMGADGWELIDDMQTGITGGEGLVFKRPIAGRAPRASQKSARRSAKQPAKRAAKRPARRG